MDPLSVSVFDGVLQGGFIVACTVGTTIRGLLCDQFGISEQIVEEKISTIFLNGKPVDDIDAVIAENDATLALSGAIPGLVGATLRRKSPLASFRQTISSPYGQEHGEGGTGAIRIKIFNILIKVLGPIFLERGIFLAGHVFQSFFANQPSGFWERCRTITINNHVLPGSASKEKVLAAVDRGWVRLTVSTKT